MALRHEVETLLRLYPQVFLACHCRHVRDAQGRKALSRNQKSILDHLDGVEHLDLHSLAKHMDVTPSTMSLNVDRLEKAGYVVRRRDAQDARRIELRLTAAGVRMKEEQQVLERKLVAELLGRLTDLERNNALAGLKLLAGAAEELMAGRQGQRGFQEKKKGWK